MDHFKKISSFCSQQTWTLPFLAFTLGYISLQFFMTDFSIIQAPDLVGKDLLQATKVCSDRKLNLRIIAEKEIADAKPGTIIKQNPLPHSSIKNHQSIFIIITKLPIPVLAPDLINKNCDQIEKLCKEKGIKNRIYYLPAIYPAGQCFAQIPEPQTQLDDKKMSCYISTGNQNQFLFPDFTNHTVQAVLPFLEQHRIKFDIYQKDQKLTAPYHQHLKISYQKPLAGTLVTPNDKLYVQLQVL